MSLNWLSGLTLWTEQRGWSLEPQRRMPRATGSHLQGRPGGGDATV